MGEQCGLRHREGQAYGHDPVEDLALACPSIDLNTKFAACNKAYVSEMLASLSLATTRCNNVCVAGCETAILLPLSVWCPSSGVRIAQCTVISNDASNGSIKGSRPDQERITNRPVRHRQSKRPSWSGTHEVSVNAQPRGAI